MRQALDGYRQGLDFADSLHLAASDQAEAFASFDNKLKKRAAAIAGAIAAARPVIAP